MRTARVTLESRYLWDVYHADGIARDVYWQMLGERSEQDVFQCLAWLYDGVRGAGRRRARAETLDGPLILDSIGAQANQRSAADARATP